MYINKLLIVICNYNRNSIHTVLTLLMCSKSIHDSSLKNTGHLKKLIHIRKETQQNVIHIDFYTVSLYINCTQY